MHPPDPPPEPHPDRPPAWDDRWQAAWDDRDPSLPPRVAVRVVRIDRGGITVAPDLSRTRQVVAAKAVRRVVVGDVCALDDDAGRLEEILPRRSVFERRAPGAARDDVAATAKALAANMDLVLVLQALDTGVNHTRLAREMVLAWESGAQPVVVLTKADRVDRPESARQRAEARRFAPGVPVVCVCVSSDPGGAAHGTAADLDELRAHLPEGSVAVLLGASGAGKSTLANALAGRPVQLTAEVRPGDLRGRHTTTAGQMIPLTEGRWLIDTPGIRGVGLWRADEGLERAFADLAPHAERCRFADCTHRSEPGCGITEAVATGEVAVDRVETWHALLAEIEALEQEVATRDREVERQENQRSRHRAAHQRGRPRR